MFYFRPLPNHIVLVFKVYYNLVTNSKYLVVTNIIKHAFKIVNHKRRITMETKNYYKNQLTKALLYTAISATIFVSIFAGLDSIRYCIAFPKNNSGRDVMMDAPSTIAQEQLDELCIAVALPEEK